MRGVGSAGPDASVNRAHFSGGEKSGNLGLQVGRDGRDAMEWIAAQPWSSGEVFMYGGSYVGMTPWRTAAQLPPHLSGIAPSVPIYPGWDIPSTNGIPEAFTAVILVYVAGCSLNTDFFASDYWQIKMLEHYAAQGSFRTPTEASSLCEGLSSRSHSCSEAGVRAEPDPFRRQVALGLDGHPDAILKARVFLSEWFGGQQDSPGAAARWRAHGPLESERWRALQGPGVMWQRGRDLYFAHP